MVRQKQSRRGVFVAPLAALSCLALLLLLSSCALIRDIASIPRLKEDLYQQIGVPFVFTDYEDEGRTFFITNDCDIDQPTVEDEPGSGRERLIRWSDADYRQVVDTFIETAQGCMKAELTDDLPTAVEMVKKYKWIEVNGSLKNTSLAIALTGSKLQKLFGRYQEAEDNLRGAVLVYLPQGPRVNEMETLDLPYPNEDQREDMWEEMHNLLCGCYPSLHPRFFSTLYQLVRGTAEQGYPILVWAKSYAGHQVLQVVKEEENVFFYNVGPSFGLFNKGVTGVTRWEQVDGRDCTNWTICNEGERAGLGWNPLITTYRSDLETATVPQCMLTSFNDCISLHGDGSALTTYTNYDWFTRSNMCPELLGASALNPYLVEYVDPADWDHTFDPPDAMYCFSYGNPTLRLPLTDARGDACKRYGSPFTTHRIWRNLDLAGGPNSIRVVRVRGEESGVANPESPRHDAAHMEYFVEIPKALSEVLTSAALGGHSQCTVDFPSPCPACPTADDVMDSGRPLYEHTLELFYEQGRSSWPALTLPNEAPVRNDDVIYLPISSPIEEARLLEAAGAVTALDDPAYPGQYHVSGVESIRLETQTFASDDPEGDDEAAEIHMTMWTPDMSHPTLHFWEPEAWPDWYEGYREARTVFFSDMAGTADIADRVRVDHHSFWWPREPFMWSSPYSDLHGAWLDVVAEAVIRRMPGATLESVQGEEKRVLVMRNWYGDAASFPMALSDVRNFVPPASRILASDTAAAIPFEVFVPNSAALGAVSVHPMTMAEFEPADIGATNTGSYLAPEGSGRYYTFVATWDARETWCTLDDWRSEICGGDGVVIHPPQDVHMRIRAANSEGAHFFRDYTLTVWHEGA